MYIYDLAAFGAEQMKGGIHHIFKFQQRCSEVPNVVYDSTDNVINIVGGKIREGLLESLESKDPLNLRESLESRDPIML